MGFGYFIAINGNAFFGWKLERDRRAGKLVNDSPELAVEERAQEDEKPSKEKY